MTKSKLLSALVAENPNLTAAAAEAIVSQVHEAIAKALSAGGGVRLEGFGNFGLPGRSVRARKSPRFVVRQGKSPKAKTTTKQNTESLQIGSAPRGTKRVSARAIEAALDKVF